MTPKTKYKKHAINLRKQGFTYNEILSKVPVAKSTLSLWLRSVGLSKLQKQSITERRIKNAKKGIAKQHFLRLERMHRIKSEAMREIPTLSYHNIWLIGIALYWAEGYKEKLYRSSQLTMANSDPNMIIVYLTWLKICLGIKEEQLSYQIRIHENHKNQISHIKKQWSQLVNVPLGKLDKVYYKRHNPNTNRKNKGNHYLGLLVVNVRSSADLNRRVSGWIEGIVKECRVV